MGKSAQKKNGSTKLGATRKNKLELKSVPKDPVARNKPNLALSFLIVKVKRKT